jgi:PIF1-like helicase
LAQIHANLEGVDYIFLDEVSMLSCRDLYQISAQCAKAKGEPNKPFGGINFIFAGDFAQLPPAINATPLYSGQFSDRVNAGQTINQQETAIGKALWHQVTTVVILQENTRQQFQSEKDSKFRKALENMRYKACTHDDIQFLQSRIAGKCPNDPKLAQKRFRNVSVITALNTQKDMINQLGCQRFATENNQVLTSFYSIDKWKDTDVHQTTDKNNYKKHKTKLNDPV